MKLKVVVPLLVSFCDILLTLNTATSSSVIVPVAVAVPIETCCPFALTNSIVPLKFSDNSVTKSPNISIGIFTDVVNGCIVYSTFVCAVKSDAPALEFVVENLIITGSCAGISIVATKLCKSLVFVSLILIPDKLICVTGSSSVIVPRA